jgi:hypothetical protein
MKKYTKHKIIGGQGVKQSKKTGALPQVKSRGGRRAERSKTLIQVKNEAQSMI